jgi:zinc protease
MRQTTILSLLFLSLLACRSHDHGSAAPTAAPRQAALEAAAPRQLQVVTLDSRSPLVEVKLMVRAGSTADPEGLEGLSFLTARALIQGAFGDPANPTTKEDLAEITQSWGSGAYPRALASSRTTTYSFTIPRDVLDTYLDRVLRPMLTQPLFLDAEIERLKSETLSQISSVRLEDLENLGLAAIDAYIFRGTRYGHQPFGAELTVPRITREEVHRFYRDFYRPENMILGVSTADREVVDRIRGVVEGINRSAAGSVRQVDAGRPATFEGREAVVIEEPNAPAASVHLGFPLAINRSHPDFWPLYVANVWFGTHRDSFGRLYQAIREERGYNYGSYSYVEFLSNRPQFLFPPFNTPRELQYFSIWLRPIQHDFAAHLARAATFELEQLIRQGLTPEQVSAAKIKARVLYLNLADSVDRLLGARMDDAFYGMTPGYLEGYIDRIDAVTPEQLNAAIRRHLQSRNIRYLFVTNSEHAAALAEQLRTDAPALGKTLEDYDIEQVTLPDGRVVWQIPEERLRTLQLDAAWAHFPLQLREVVHAPVSALFRTGDFLARDAAVRPAHAGSQ